MQESVVKVVEFQAYSEVRAILVALIMPVSLNDTVSFPDHGGAVLLDF